MISSQVLKWLSTIGLLPQGGRMKKIMLSMYFTEEEAKAVKKAFEQVSLEKQLFLEDEWKWSKEKRLVEKKRGIK